MNAQKNTPALIRARCASCVREDSARVALYANVHSTYRTKVKLANTIKPGISKHRDHLRIVAVLGSMVCPITFTIYLCSVYSQTEGFLSQSMKYSSFVVTVACGSACV